MDNKKNQLKSMWSITLVTALAAITLGTIAFFMLLKHELQLRKNSTAFISELFTATKNEHSLLETKSLQVILKNYFQKKALVTISPATEESILNAGEWKVDSSFSVASVYTHLKEDNLVRKFFIKVQWPSPYSMSGDSLAWTLIVGVPILMIFLSTTITFFFKESILNPMNARLLKLKEKVEERQSMQMFAHDIRKPFSAFKAMLEIMRNPKSQQDIKGLIKKLLPELDSLLLHVDGMIQDVMKNRSEANQLEPVNLDRLLTASVRETEKRHPNANHKLNWNLRHSLKVNAVEKALIRSISNILCNAIEVIGDNDVLWITSRDTKISGAPAVEIILGNSGSLIPDSIIAKLFDPFFTSGKIDGTGLGLAYVKKVVEGFVGTISVNSDPTTGTEFNITLPTSSILDKPTCVLPAFLNESDAHGQVPAEDYSGLVPMIREIMTKKGLGKIEILVVEDEEFYFDSIAASIPDDQEAFCVFDHATNFQQARHLLENKAYDFVICDLDLGSEYETGIDVIKILEKSDTKVFMHTNKSMSAGDCSFLEKNTDGFLNKPVAAHSLLKIILDHALASPARNSEKKQASRPKVAIIDDDCFVRELWSLQTCEVEPIIYDSPVSFLKEISANSDLLESFDAIIIDYYFDNDPTYTGDRLAKEIRGLVNVPIIMSSDANLPGSATTAFDGKIEKSCFSWTEISKRLAI